MKKARAAKTFIDGVPVPRGDWLRIPRVRRANRRARRAWQRRRILATGVMMSGSAGAFSPTTHVYNTAGGATETIPGGVTCLLEVWSGSGGGGAGNTTACVTHGGGGGGSGSYGKISLSVAGHAGGTMNVTVGAAGAAAGAGGASSVTSGTFTLTSVLTNGGGGGGNATAGAGGTAGAAGAAGSGGSTNTAGNAGGAGGVNTTGAGGAGIVGTNGTGSAGGAGRLTGGANTGGVGLVIFAYS